MNTEKIMDKYGNQDQRIDLLCIRHPAEALADRVDGRRRFIGSERCEQHETASGRICRADIVLRILEGAADPALGILEQIPVELQDVSRTQGNILEILVDRVQYVSVSGDLPLIPVPGRGFFRAKLLKTCIGCANPLDLIGSLRALDLCDLNQTLQIPRLALEKKLLPPFILMDLRNISQDFTVPGSGF